jgi:hypothetical protein
MGGPAVRDGADSGQSQDGPVPSLRPEAQMPTGL